jgi:hypothetical protein
MNHHGKECVMGKSRYVKLIVALILAITFAVPAWGEDEVNETRPNPCMAPPAEAIVFDALIMRPLGLVAMAVGAVFSIVAYPFAFASGSKDSVTQKLIYEPYAFTFLRPMGVDDYNFCQD